MQRYSHQRERIYETVCGTTSHPTAEMVYSSLKEELPRLSLGTVYRNLQQMAREGRLRQLDGPVARFDANIAPHTHLTCGSCGGVVDLDFLPYDSRLDRLAEETGCSITDHSLMFYGLCPAYAGKAI